MLPIGFFAIPLTMASTSYSIRQLGIILAYLLMGIGVASIAAILLGSIAYWLVLFFFAARYSLLQMLATIISMALLTSIYLETTGLWRYSAALAICFVCLVIIVAVLGQDPRQKSVEPERLECVNQQSLIVPNHNPIRW